jgi:hypothetical protein
MRLQLEATTKSKLLTEVMRFPFAIVSSVVLDANLKFSAA